MTTTTSRVAVAALVLLVLAAAVPVAALLEHVVLLYERDIMLRELEVQKCIRGDETVLLKPPRPTTADAIEFLNARTGKTYYVSGPGRHNITTTGDLATCEYTKRDIAGNLYFQCTAEGLGNVADHDR